MFNFFKKKPKPVEKAPKPAAKIARPIKSREYPSRASSYDSSNDNLLSYVAMGAIMNSNSTAVEHKEAVTESHHVTEDPGVAADAPSSDGGGGGCGGD